MLLVDDQPAVRAVLRLMLEALGARVVDAEGVDAALAIAGDGPYAMIWLDISMPGTDGIQGARLFRAHASLAAARLVALTADTEPDQRARYREAGFDDVVGKPATLADLRAAIRRAGL